MADLKQSVTAAGGAVFGNASLNLQSILGTTFPGQPKDLLGVNTVDTTLTDTANGGADVVSAMFCDARVDELQAALAYAVLMEPRVMAADDPDTLTIKLTFYQSTGEGIQNVNGIAKIITGAT